MSDQDEPPLGSEERREQTRQQVAELRAWREGGCEGPPPGPELKTLGELALEDAERQYAENPTPFRKWWLDRERDRADVREAWDSLRARPTERDPEAERDLYERVLRWRLPSRIREIRARRKGAPAP